MFYLKVVDTLLASINAMTSERSRHDSGTGSSMLFGCTTHNYEKLKSD